MAEIDTVPINIYVFCNSCEPNWHSCIALAENGDVVGQHICSHHGWMSIDLGANKASEYDSRFPHGWVLRLVEADDAGLLAAVALAEAALGVQP